MDDLQKSTAAAALGLSYSASKCPDWMIQFIDDAADTFRAFRQTGGVRQDFMPLLFIMAKQNERIKALEAMLAPKLAAPDKPTESPIDLSKLDRRTKEYKEQAAKLTAAGV